MESSNCCSRLGLERLQPDSNRAATSSQQTWRSSLTAGMPEHMRGGNSTAPLRSTPAEIPAGGGEAALVGGDELVVFRIRLAIDHAARGIGVVP